MPDDGSTISDSGPVWMRVLACIGPLWALGGPGRPAHLLRRRLMELLLGHWCRSGTGSSVEHGRGDFCAWKGTTPQRTPRQHVLATDSTLRDSNGTLLGHHVDPHLNLCLVMPRGSLPFRSAVVAVPRLVLLSPGVGSFLRSSSFTFFSSFTSPSSSVCREVRGGGTGWSTPSSANVIFG